MEILTKPSDSTAAGPRWVLLNHYSEHDRDSSADAKTTAASCTSSGLPFTVSFSVPAPLAASSFHGHWVGGDGVGGTPASDGDDEYSGSDDDCSYCSYAIPNRELLESVSEPPTRTSRHATSTISLNLLWLRPTNNIRTSSSGLLTHSDRLPRRTDNRRVERRYDNRDRRHDDRLESSRAATRYRHTLPITHFD